MNKACYRFVMQAFWGWNRQYNPGGRKHHLLKAAGRYYKIRNALIEKLPTYRKVGDGYLEARERLAKRRRQVAGGPDCYRRLKVVAQ